MHYDGFLQAFGQFDLALEDVQLTEHHSAAPRQVDAGLPYRHELGTTQQFLKTCPFLGRHVAMGVPRMDTGRVQLSVHSLELRVPDERDVDHRQWLRSRLVCMDVKYHKGN